MLSLQEDARGHTPEVGFQGAATVKKMGKQEANTELLAPEGRHLSCHLGMGKVPPP